VSSTIQSGVLFRIKQCLLMFFIVVGIGVLVSDANAEISGLESYPLVCQKGLVALDHDINSFNRLFGLPMSENSRKLTEPGYEGEIVTTDNYRNAVSLIYVTTATQKYMVYVLKLGSKKALKIIGFDVETERDVRQKYGDPYEESPSSLVYGCDNVEITFKIKNGRVETVDIVVSDI